MGKHVLAIVGGYRRDGVTAQAVEAILEGARQQGAVTKTIWLIDRPIEFCTNCRACTQAKGEERGKCLQQDGLASILAEAEQADALVLASPVNYWNVTAVTRRFLERLLGATYWPWGGHAPALRRKRPMRKAALVSSCAMPLGWMLPLLTGAPKALRLLAESLGARPVSRFWSGMSSERPRPELSAAKLRRAQRIGAALV